MFLIFCFGAWSRSLMQREGRASPVHAALISSHWLSCPPYCKNVHFTKVFKGFWLKIRFRDVSKVEIGRAVDPVGISKATYQKHKVFHRLAQTGFFSVFPVFRACVFRCLNHDPVQDSKTIAGDLTFKTFISPMFLNGFR